MCGIAGIVGERDDGWIENDSYPPHERKRDMRQPPSICEMLLVA